LDKPVDVSWQASAVSQNQAASFPIGRRGFLLYLIIADHTAINAGFDLRRYAMKPMPAKPSSSIAHVQGREQAKPMASSRASGAKGRTIKKQ